MSEPTIEEKVQRYVAGEREVITIQRVECDCGSDGYNPHYPGCATFSWRFRIPAAIATAEAWPTTDDLGPHWELHSLALAKALWNVALQRLDQFASEAYLSSTEHLRALRDFTQEVESR